MPQAYVIHCFLSIIVKSVISFIAIDVDQTQSPKVPGLWPRQTTVIQGRLRFEENLKERPDLREPRPPSRHSSPRFDLANLSASSKHLRGRANLKERRSPLRYFSPRSDLVDLPTSSDLGTVRTTEKGSSFGRLKGDASQETSINNPESFQNN